MAADYQFLDALGSTTFFGNWAATFYVTNNIWTQPYITIGYKTRYATQDRAASVQVNTQTIAKLAPRPWTPGEFILRTEEVTLPFPFEILTAGFLQPNVVRVVNVPPDVENFIFIRSALVHYKL